MIKINKIGNSITRGFKMSSPGSEFPSKYQRRYMKKLKAQIDCPSQQDTPFEDEVK